MDNVFFQSSSIMGVGGTVTVGRPDIFGMRFATDRAFDVFLAVVLALCLIGVGALRRGPLRATAGEHERLARGVQHRGAEPHRHEARSCSRSRPGSPGSPARCTAGSRTVVGAAQFDFLFSIAIFVGVTLSGVNLLTGAVLAGVFIAVGPVIGAHIPQIPDLTQLLIGFGVVTIGRNPNGIGKFYAEVTDFWNRRQGRVGADPRPVGPGPDLAPAPAPAPARPERRRDGGAFGCLSSPSRRSPSASAGSRRCRTSISRSMPEP